MPSIYADTVIRNANIITIDNNRPRAQALAMLHGRFAAVGSPDDVADWVGSDTKVLDLDGKTVLPGFIDAHIHVLNSGIRHVMAADCAQPTVAAIQDELRKRLDVTPPGQWVQGFKFDDTKTAENRFLNRADLDAVSAEHPILVAHRAGHVYYMNSLGLQLAGFTRDTPDPSGGRLGRDSDTGELDGVVYERAIEPVRFGLIPVETSEIRREGLRTICGMLNEAGLTSVHTTPGLPQRSSPPTRRATKMANCPCVSIAFFIIPTSPPCATLGWWRALVTTACALAASRWWPTGQLPAGRPTCPPPTREAAATMASWPWRRTRLTSG